jgi:hypothetical protein
LAPWTQWFDVSDGWESMANTPSADFTVARVQPSRKIELFSTFICAGMQPAPQESVELVVSFV